MLNEFFEQALAEAARAIEEGSGGPFGAVVVCRNKIVGRGRNTVLGDHDPTAHAEIGAIRQAAAELKSPHLNECFLVATAEPCPMCLMAARWAKLQKIYYAAPCSLAASYGFADAKLYHAVEKTGIELIEVADFRRQTERLFMEWQEKGGILY